MESMHLQCALCKSWRTCCSLLNPRKMTFPNLCVTSTDLVQQNKLASMLLSGEYHQDLVQKYPELSDTLQLNLSFFWRHYKASSVEKYRQIFKAMDPAVRRTFEDVKALLRLLVISPASSTEAERSFSALRRLKTWLRSTMRQEMLNHVMICHVHREELSRNASKT